MSAFQKSVKREYNSQGKVNMQIDGNIMMVVKEALSKENQ